MIRMAPALLVLTILATGCPQPTDVSTGKMTNVSFALDVQPILTAQCSDCHSVGGFAESTGLLLTEDVAHAELATTASVLDGDLAFVVAGDPDASYLIEKIEADFPARGIRMPMFLPPMTENDVKVIRAWILEGAEDN